MDGIDGVLIYKVTTIVDDRGMIIKPSQSIHYVDTYVSTVRKNAIKAWHGYNTKTLCWTALDGVVQLVLHDMRELSPTYNCTDTIFLGENSMHSVVVPPGVYNGFKGISTKDAIILVQADELYAGVDHRLPYNTELIEYNWSTHHG